MKRLKEAVSSIYYTHGLICASHPLSIFAITFSFVFLCCYPLSKLPFPGTTPAPLHHSTPLTEIPSNVSFQHQSLKPIWYSGSSAGNILQILVTARIHPWKRDKLYPADAFRTPLLKAFDIVDLINAHQLQKHVENGQEISVSDLCMQVSETLTKKDPTKILPQYNCLIVSPANVWKLRREKFDNDGSIMETVYKSVHNVEKHPLLKDIVFGVPWQETGMKRFYFRNRQRIVTFAVTVVLKKVDSDFLQSLASKLYTLYPTGVQNHTYEGEITHVYFKARNYFFVEHTPLIAAYIVLFLYIYFSVRKIEMVKSKWGLALAAVATVVASLLMSIGICTFFGLQPILLGEKILEIFPYLVVIVGLENVLILTKSVSSTSGNQDVKYRVAEGLCKEGWSITKNLVYELLILLFGFFTFVPEIQEFCLFAVVGLLSDFFLQVMFFATVLSIDIRRLELADLERADRMRSRRSFSESKGDKHPQPLMNCPYVKLRSSSRQRARFPSPTTLQNPTVGSGPDYSRRLRLIEFVTRYRMVQRMLMFCTTVWIILLIYKTGIASYMVNVTLNVTPSPSVENNPDLAQSPFHSTLLDEDHEDSKHQDKLLHDQFQEQNWKKLPNAHWPTLFSFYNISLWNKYVSILPPIRLRIDIPPEVAENHRHKDEAVSKLDWLPPGLPEHIDKNTMKHAFILQANAFYPRTKQELYITIVLGIISTFITVYLMVWCYGCMCSRNYAKWRTDWSKTLNTKYGGKYRRRISAYMKHIRPGMPLSLEGHKQQIECIDCNGEVIVSSCIGGEIRIWDFNTGECLTTIPSARSSSPIHVRNDLEDPLDQLFELRTDFENQEASEQNVSPTQGYNFTPFFVPQDQLVQRRLSLPDESSSTRDERERSVSFRSEGHRRNSSLGNLSDSFGDCNLSTSMSSERVSAIWSLVSQDTIVIAGCSDGRIEVWDNRGQFKTVYAADSAGVTALIVRGNRLVAARLNGTIDFITLETFSSSMEPVPEKPNRIFMRGHHRARSGSRMNTGVINWNDIIKCTLVTSYRAHQRIIVTMRSEGGRLVTASRDHTLKVYKMDDCLGLYTLHGHSAPLTCLFLDQNQPLGAISGCEQGTVRVWDLLTGACVHELTRPVGSTKDSVAVSVVATAVYVAASYADGYLFIWERCRGILKHNVKMDPFCPAYLSILTSNVLISTGIGKILIWDLPRGEVLNALQLSDQDTSTCIKEVVIVNNSLFICDFGNQLRCVPFPSAWAKSD